MKKNFRPISQTITLSILFFSTTSFVHGEDLATSLGTLRTSLSDLAGVLAPGKKGVPQTTKKNYFKTIISLTFNEQSLEKTFGMQKLLRERIEDIKWFNIFTTKCLTYLPLNKDIEFPLFEIGLQERIPEPEKELAGMKEMVARITEIENFTKFVSAIKDFNFTWAFLVTDPDKHDDSYITAEFALNQRRELGSEIIKVMNPIQESLQKWAASDAHIYFKNLNLERAFSVPLAKVSKECNVGKIKQEIQMPLTITPYALQQAELKITVDGPTLKEPYVITASWNKN